MQKSLAFLHTNNERSEREIKETIPFTTITEKERKSNPKEAKHYTENYKILIKEIKDNIKTWRDIPCS